MPEAIAYIADVNSKAAGDLDETYIAELNARIAQYKAAWNYYTGTHKQHLKPDKTNTDDNVIINLVELAIDKAVSNLMGTTDQGTIKGPDFDVVEAPMNPVAQFGKTMKQVLFPGAAVEASEQDYLNRAWEANRKSILLHDMAVSGGLYGWVALKIIPDGVADPNGGRLPRIVNLNPWNITPFWDAGDMDRVLWYRIQYGPTRSDDSRMGRKREDIVRLLNADGSDAEQWAIYTYVEAPGRKGWTLKGKPALWDYPWAPIVDWKNLPLPGQYFGLDDIRNNGNLNDGLNFVASNVQRIIKHHASPKTIATGTDAKKITQSAINSLWTINEADARVYNLEMQSDLGSSLEFAQFLRRAFFDGVRELDPGTVQDKLGALTNFGLRVLFRDSLEKTGTKRLMYGQGLRLVCQRVLELGGFGPNQQVTDKWPDPLPTDPLVTAQALQIDRANGLSQSTYLERRGYQPEVEAQNRENEIGETVLKDTLGRQGAMVDGLRNGGNVRNSNNNTRKQ